MLTELCPNRCEYCYIKNRDNPNSMTTDRIDSIMEKYHPFRVIFFGGEPLTRLDLMKYTVKKYYGKTRFQVVTSTCVNFKEFVEFQKEYPFSEIQLSWDGFNRNRPNQNDQDTSLRVWENIQYGVSEGMKFDVKCVVSNDNVKQLREIHNIFKELKPKGVSGQIVIAHRELYTEEFYEELEKNLIYTFDLDKMYMDNLNKIMAYLAKDRNYSSCDAGNYMVIDPYGRESYCTALSQEKHMELTIEDLKEPCTHTDCKSCELSYLCDGGCRYERYLVYGDKWRDYYLESTCRVNKIYYNTIRRFMDNLSNEETRRLLDIITHYKSFLREYYGT